jgi:PAT family acetyl-CoA transporter-like MFS transporter 1
MKRKPMLEKVEENEFYGSYSSSSPAINDVKANKLFYWDFALLCFLYCLQGVPLGLAGGSIPFLLKAAGASYTNIGIFSVSMIPFSLKLAWAPAVDGSWISSLGRRKSWIIPCQVFSGVVMVAVSFWVDEWVQQGSVMLAVVFFVLILAFATQDIAVDGWALELMSENLSHASTAQSVGQNIGFFCGFTVFLGAQSFGWISLGQFLWVWGVIFVLTSLLLWQFVSEAPPSSLLRVDSVRSVYAQLFQISRLPDVRRFVLYLLTCGVGFTAHDKALHLRLIEAGFSKELLATMGLLGLPLSVAFAVVAGRWAR